jgi:hypothetical protein
MNSEAELTQLKQEVNELWSRYRKHEPWPTEDEGRRLLAEKNRSLEAKRRVLSDRSSTLRLELEQHRRRASRLSPVVRVFGGLVGSLVMAVLLAMVLSEVAALSVALTAAQGAAVLTGSLLLVALSVSRADR